MQLVPTAPAPTALIAHSPLVLRVLSAVVHPCAFALLHGIESGTRRSARAVALGLGSARGVAGRKGRGGGVP